jgi:hypothetical protein
MPSPASQPGLAKNGCAPSCAGVINTDIDRMSDNCRAPLARAPRALRTRGRPGTLRAKQTRSGTCPDRIGPRPGSRRAPQRRANQWRRAPKGIFAACDFSLDLWCDGFGRALHLSVGRAASRKGSTAIAGGVTISLKDFRTLLASAAVLEALARQVPAESARQRAAARCSTPCARPPSTSPTRRQSTVAATCTRRSSPPSRRACWKASPKRSSAAARPRARAISHPHDGDRRLTPLQATIKPRSGHRPSATIRLIRESRGTKSAASRCLKLGCTSLSPPSPSTSKARSDDRLIAAKLGEPCRGLDRPSSLRRC